MDLWAFTSGYSVPSPTIKKTCRLSLLLNAGFRKAQATQIPVLGQIFIESEFQKNISYYLI
jgi:hypothetical protein